MKKITSLVMTVIMLITLFTFSVSAQENVSVYIDGTKINFDVQPQIINGRTMVPMRKIFEELGAVVFWDNSAQTAIGIKENTTIQIAINDYTLYKNGIANILDVPAQLIDGRTLVPIRAISESFGCNVEWKPETKSVLIHTHTASTTPTYDIEDYENDEKLYETEEKKPFIMRKLASAKIKSLSHATFDGNQSIYYIDTEKREVYSLDIKSGEKTKIFETGELTYKEGAGENVTTYTDFYPLQVFYDEINQRLLLNGCYQKTNKPGEMPKEDLHQFIYNLTDGADGVYCQPDWASTWRNDIFSTIQTFLNDDSFLLSGKFGSTYKVNAETGKIKDIRLWVGYNHEKEYAYTAVLKNKNNIYGIELVETISNYDFGEDEDYVVFSGGQTGIGWDGFGIFKEYYYIWKEDAIYRISVKTRTAEFLDISTKGNNVEFEDMGNMNYIDGKFFVVDENTFIFYDHDMEAFRILSRQI